jgi:hypothetical protein
MICGTSGSLFTDGVVERVGDSSGVDGRVEGTEGAARWVWDEGQTGNSSSSSPKSGVGGIESKAGIVGLGVEGEDLLREGNERSSNSALSQMITFWVVGFQNFHPLKPVG